MILEDGSEYPEEPDPRCAIVGTSALLFCSKKVAPLFPRSLPSLRVRATCLHGRGLSHPQSQNCGRSPYKVNEDGRGLGLDAAGSPMLIGSGF